MKRAQRTISFDIGISERDKKSVIELLRSLVSDEFVLYAKALNFHWNVIGEHFGPLHKLFLDNYEMLLQIVDDVSERIRSLGAAAPGSLKEFLERTQLKECPGITEEGAELLAILYEDHLLLIRSLRKIIYACQRYKDEGTANFLTEIMEQHEKAAWMVRAHLE